MKIECTDQDIRKFEQLCLKWSQDRGSYAAEMLCSVLKFNTDAGLMHNQKPAARFTSQSKTEFQDLMAKWDNEHPIPRFI